MHGRAIGFAVLVAACGNGGGNVASSGSATAAKPVESAPAATAPPASTAVHDCVLDDPELALTPITASLAGSTLTYCIGPGIKKGSGPACFTANLETKVVTSIAPTPAALAYQPSYDGPDRAPAATIEGVDEVTKVCTVAKVCTTLAIKPEDSLAVSSDGTIAALLDPKGRVSTYEVATGKRIARFKIRSKQPSDEEGAPEVGFFSHDVVGIWLPCAGPCGEGMLYTATGKQLGPLAVEATTLAATRLHDDVWLVGSIDEHVAIQDAATGKVLMNQKFENSIAVASSDRIAVVVGGALHGKVVVFDHEGTQTLEIPVPICATK